MSFGPWKKLGNPIDHGGIGRGLVAAYRFNERGGTKLYDSAGNNRCQASFLNTPTWSVGPRGPAVAFSGTAEASLLNLPISVIRNGASIVCLAMTTSSANQAFYTNGDGTGSGYFGLGIGGVTSFAPYLYGSSSMPNVNGTAVASSEWVHMVGVFHGNFRELWQNGVRKTRDTAGWGVPTITSRADIASFGSAASTLQGRIDHVYIFNRVLPPEEIALLYADPDCILYSPRKTFLFIAPATGSGAFTFDAMTVSGAGTVVNPVTGSAAFTLAAMTIAGAGTVVNPVTGSAAFTLADMTVSGAGTVVAPVTGTAAFTLADMTVAGAGSVVNPVTGTAAFTFDPMTVSGSGTVVEPVTGTASFTLGAMTVSGAGTVVNPVAGTAAFTFDPMVVSGSGTVLNPVTGTASFTFDPMTVAGSGTFFIPEITGAGFVTFDAMTIFGRGRVVNPVPPSICPGGRVVAAIGAGRACAVGATAGATRTPMAVLGAGKGCRKWTFGSNCGRVSGSLATAGNFLLSAIGRLLFRGRGHTGSGPGDPGSGSGTAENFLTSAIGNQAFRGTVFTAQNPSLDANGGVPFVTYSECKDEIQLNFNAVEGELYTVQIATDSTGPWYDHFSGLGSGLVSARLNNDYRGNYWFRVLGGLTGTDVVKSPEKPDASIVEPPGITISNTSAFARQALWDNGGIPIAYDRHVNARINKEDWFLVPRERRRYLSGVSANYDHSPNVVSITGADGALHKWTRDGTDPQVDTLIRPLDGIANNAAAYRSDFGYMIKARSFLGGCRSPMTCILVDKELYETHNNLALGEGQLSAAECDLPRTDSIRLDWSRDNDGNFESGLSSWTFRSGNDCEDSYGGDVRHYVIQQSRENAITANSRSLSFQRIVNELVGGVIADYGTGDAGMHRSGFLWDEASCSVFAGNSGFAWTRTATWNLFPPCYSNVCVGFAGGGSAPIYSVNHTAFELTGPLGTTSAIQDLASTAMVNTVGPLFSGDSEGTSYYDVYAYLTVHNDATKPVPHGPYVPPAEPPDPPPVIIPVNGDDFELYLDYADATLATLNGGDGFSGAWVITDHNTPRGYEDFEEYDDGAISDGSSSLDGRDGWAGSWTFRASADAVGQEDFESYTDVRGMNGGTGWTGPWETRFSYFGPVGGDDFEFYADANPAPATLESGELFNLPWLITDIGFFGMETFESYPDGNVTNTENAGEKWGSAWLFSDH